MKRSVCEKLGGWVAGIMILVAAVGVMIFGHGEREAETPEYRLQVTPTHHSLGTVEPGKTYQGAFMVQNTGTKAFNYTVGIQPYSVEGEIYSPNLVRESEYTEMTHWVTIESPKGEVAGGKEVKVQYKVTVPKDAPGKSQSIALTVTMTGTDDNVEGSGAVLQQQVATVVLANVAGETRATGEVVSNEITGFIFEPPIKTSARIKNTGNVNTVATFQVEVMDLGGNVIYSNAEEDKIPYQVMLPETEFVHEDGWVNAPQLGIFKVKQIVTIFDQESVEERLVLVCPIWFMVFVVAFVGVLGYCIYDRVKLYKRYKAAGKGKKKEGAKMKDGIKKHLVRKNKGMIEPAEKSDDTGDAGE